MSAYFRMINRCRPPQNLLLLEMTPQNHVPFKGCDESNPSKEFKEITVKQHNLPNYFIVGPITYIKEICATKYATVGFLC